MFAPLSSALTALRLLFLRYPKGFTLAAVFSLVAQVANVVLNAGIILVILGQHLMPDAVAVPALLAMFLIASGSRYLSHRIVLWMERDYTKDGPKANIALLFGSAAIFRSGLVLVVFLSACLIGAPLPTLSILFLAICVYWYLRSEIVILDKTGAELGRSIVEGRSRLTVGSDIILGLSLVIIYLFSREGEYFTVAIHGSVLYYIFAIRQALAGLQTIASNLQKLILVSQGLKIGDEEDEKAEAVA